MRAVPHPACFYTSELLSGPPAPTGEVLTLQFRFIVRTAREAADALVKGWPSSDGEEYFAEMRAVRRCDDRGCQSATAARSHRHGGRRSGCHCCRRGPLIRQTEINDQAQPK
jgi:hypothetical protein